MKKIIQAVGLVAFMAMVVFALCSFAKLDETNSEKSCKVTIKYGNGDPADGVTVSANYYSSLLGSAGFHDFKTDDNGVVTLTWDEHEIKYLYIKGDKYEVDYSNGKSYTLTLKKKHKYD